MVLRAGGGVGREFSVDAADRRAVLADTVLRQPSDGGMVAGPRSGSESQACPAADADDEAGGHLPEAADDDRGSGAPDLSVSAAERNGDATEPGVERGYHVCALTLGVFVLDGDSGLVQPLRAGVAVVEQSGRGLLRGGVGRGVALWSAGDFQHRPGGAV